MQSVKAAVEQGGAEIITLASDVLIQRIRRIFLISYRRELRFFLIHQEQEMQRRQ